MLAASFVAFGGLGIAACLGVLWPYPPMSLATRWRHRRPARRMIVRWVALLLGVLLASVLAVAAWAAGIALATRVAGSRAVALRSFLADPLSS